jgi:hypothetical protein
LTAPVGSLLLILLAQLALTLDAGTDLLAVLAVILIGFIRAKSIGPTLILVAVFRVISGTIKLWVIGICIRHNPAPALGVVLIFISDPRDTFTGIFGVEVNHGGAHVRRSVQILEHDLMLFHFSSPQM